MIRLPLLIGLVFTSLAAGCGTMRPFDALTGRQTADQTTVADASSRPWSGLASRFRKSDPESDALILDKQALSEGFQKSRGGLTTKGLRDPEATNLAFARWKEDVGQYAESKARYHEVLTANPNCLTARLGIARIERETGRYDQCHDILMAARKHHPNDPAVMLELGRMYNARERWDESIRSFTDAAQLAPDDLTVRYELGLALASVDRTQEAMPHLKFAVGESAAYYNIGFILSERGRAEEAVQWIERTMATHPNVRTRHMAMDLLAELESSLPASRGFTEPSSAVAASQGTPVSHPQIRAASARPHTVTRFRTDSGQRVQAQPAVATRTFQAPTEAVSEPVSGLVTYNSVPAGSVSPPQWSGPQTSQSQWTRSTRNDVFVQPTEYIQRAAGSEPTEPPQWRR